MTEDVDDAVDATGSTMTTDELELIATGSETEGETEADAEGVALGSTTEADV